MPTTYNGIGTHYYGNKNSSRRKAVCQQCGHTAELKSYETRLWFVVLFVPIIPLGRKRITDQCEVCSRHYAVPAKQWETGRQAATAAAMEQFRQEQSEESAIGVHATLLSFQQHDEAEQFRNSMLERFPDSALVHAGLAAHLEDTGLPEAAATLWDDAYRIDPELPEARIGMAGRRMAEEKLDEAHELVRFLEQPGAEQQYDLTPLFELADRYQRKSQHESALQVMEVLLRAYPHIGTDHKFRAFVQKSEKAVKSPETRLPEIKHSVSKLFTSQYSSGTRWGIGLLAAALLGAAGIAINNEYIRRHQPLTVINQTGVPAEIRIDDGSPVTVSGMQVLSVAEGNHEIHVSGPVDEQHSLTMESGYWDRWRKTPVWIVNVGGEGVIADMRVHYSSPPREPTVRMLIDPLIVRKHVDHPFEEPPDSVTVGSDRTTRTLTTLQLLSLDNDRFNDASAYYILRRENPQLAFTYARRKLLRDPNNEMLLMYVVSQLDDTEQDQFRELLEEKLDHRPVALQWHRMYHEIPSVSLDYDRLIARYDQMLSAEPDNAVLMYLRARLDKDPAESLALLKKAVATDTSFAYAPYALAYSDLSEGNWQAAEKNLTEAESRGLSADWLTPLQHQALLGQQRFTELQQRYQDRLAEDPADLASATLLAEVLTVRGQTDEAQQIINKTCASYPTDDEGKIPSQIHVTLAQQAYRCGDLPQCLQLAGKAGPDGQSHIYQMVKAENGNVSQAASGHQLTSQADERWLPLVFSLGYHQLGDQLNAAAWHNKAVEQFRMLGERHSFLTNILDTRTVTPDLIAPIAQVTDDPLDKALILTHLGVRADSDPVRKRFFLEAQRFMIQRRPPYGLLKKIHDDADSL